MVESNNVLGAVRRFVRSRSRSPGGSSRSGGYGSALGLLVTETSPIDPTQKTPKIFNTLINNLRGHISTEGLFRVSPPNRTLQQLKAKVEIGRLDPNTDPHVLAAGLKAWLRELPQGLIPPPFQERLLASESDEDIKQAITSLPDLNKATLNLLFEFLFKVSQEAGNRMNAGALAVVVGPSLFRVQATSEGLQMTNNTNAIAQKFIKDYNYYKNEFSISGATNTTKQSPKEVSSPSEKRTKVDIDNNILPNGELTPSVLAAVGSTPPPTPPLSPGKAYEKQVESSVERLLGTTQSDHDDLTDHESSPRSLDSTNVDKNKNALSSPPSQLPANQRLRLPSRSAPIRGSRRKPSRNRNSDNSSKIRSSHESLSQASAAETRSANDTSDVYERLKDGESLEGWRTECTPTTSTAPTPAETPSQTPLNAELINDSALETGDSKPVSPTEEGIHLPPKLDFSSIIPDSPTPDRTYVTPDRPPISPTEPTKLNPKIKSLVSDSESQCEGDFTVVNTPRTSPECHDRNIKGTPDVSDAVNSPINSISKNVGKINLAKESRSREKKSKTGSEVKPDSGGGTGRSHKKQISTDSEHVKEKKYRGRPRARDDHVTELIKTVSGLEKRMKEKREVSGRSEEIDKMTELQLREEKSELQRELLILEQDFGRPTAGPERQAVRLVYHRYRELKRTLSKLDTRSAKDQEAFLREIESELSKIERERRELGKSIKSWEAQFRIETKTNPTNEDKIKNKEYSRYRHLKTRRNFLQELQQQKAPESFTV